MSAFSDLYENILQASRNPNNGNLIHEWQEKVNRRIRSFVKNIARSSPFVDKPDKRMFGVRKPKEGSSITIYGTPPNAGRMKAFNAPTDEWDYTPEYYRIYGKKGWRTIHKMQIYRRTAGVPIQNVSYFGTSERPQKYFGIKKGKRSLAYGLTPSGIALPVYNKDSYADWIMTNHIDEIDNIILEAGRDVLSKAMAQGGAK